MPRPKLRLRAEDAAGLRAAFASVRQELQVPDEFPAEHERRNGHARPGAPIEVIAVRARASIPAPLRITDLPEVERSRVVGPAVVAEPDCTMWVPEGWHAEPRELGAWIVRRRR